MSVYGPDIPPVKPRVKKLRLLFILLGLGLLAGVSMVFGMMMAVASDLPALENRAEYRKAQNSLMTDVNGQPLALLTSNTGRIIVNDDEISPAMKHAIIAIEDRRYYEHPGVDLRGTGRALVQDVMAGGSAVQGGSTITQQFVKNAIKNQDQRTLFNKLREAALAFHLSRKWSKDKILTEYLNSIYFGNGAYGIESAARTYFGQDINHQDCGVKGGRRCAAELKPYEAALIAGVVSNPTAYDPVTRPQSAKKRRNLVLQRMYEQGYITATDYQRGITEPLPAPSQISPPRLRAVTPGAGYFASWVRQQLAERYGPRRAFEGGLRIQTTLDLDLQERAEASVNKWLGNPNGPSASMVVIDNGTGEVRAMVGGRDYDEKPFNLATQGQRQPGSSFKPFVLAAALRAGISPGSVWPSRKREFTVPNTGGKEKFIVNNYEGNYAGAQSLAGATTFSDNSVYAAVGIQVGIKKVARLAERMGIRTPVSRNYAITLGGLKQGVTALDMAHAYETFATGGKLVTGTLGTRDRGPVGIRSVRLRSNRDDVLAKNKAERYRILSPAVADSAVNILQSVVTSGTAKRAAIPDVRAWGKTGTTEDYGDAWFVGSTERYTVAVWVGYADKVQPMKTEWQGDSVAGGTYPAAIWHDFMTSALSLDEERAKSRCKSEKQKKTQRCQDLGLGPETVDGGEQLGESTPEAPLTDGGGTGTTGEAGGETGGTKKQGGGTDGGGTTGGGTGDGTGGGTTGGGTTGGGGGTQTPAPAPTPTPTPAPTPAPSTPGTGGAAPTGGATPSTG